MAPKSDISKKYVKMDQQEHVLHRPGMYIGSIEKDPTDVWLVNDEGDRMEKRKIDYIPGLFKIYDEIVANAIDHSIRLRTQPDAAQVKNIKITIDQESGVIEVLNDGDGIEIALHPEHKVYVPQLIFGNLLTSTNYDDDVERTGQGTNGIGCKACNIFSKWFEVETVDAHSHQIYIQKWENNMLKTGKPSIRKAAKKPYTAIRFLPDYERFLLPSGLPEDMYQIMRKRAYDACAVTEKDINIWFNGVKLIYKDFEKYVDLYLGTKSDHTRVYEKVNERWEILASYNDFCGFEQVSFVNGLLTLRGGKHVDYVVNQIVKRMTEMVVKKNKDANVRAASIKDNLIIFIKCSIVNPTFDSQSKETLTTPMSKFGSKAELSDLFMTKLFKTGISQKIMEICALTDDKTLKKTDGKKSNTIRGIPKLEDAIWAGTAKSRECTLILTEGDSAASMALAGLSEVGRDKYGVFPLKGKVMNVKDMAVKRIADNDEIANIKKILGLESGKVYTTGDVSSLRYSRIMLMTDSDVDGAHIKGLIFNLFHTLWPSLLKTGVKFMTSMLTPIIKVRKGNGKGNDKSHSFYSMTDYENWKETPEAKGDWKIKYYKGLGTSTNQEAKEYFKEMRLVNYKFTPKSDENIELAFNKKKADERKTWLSHYDRKDILDYTDTEVTFEDFVNKELIHFSNYDNDRSMPSVCDGLKTSQRKILWSCFKRNLTSEEIRVAQLAAYVSEHSAYHHGEASLQGAIVGMAQDFVGSNNINVLMPNGQFGSRQTGGKDAGQPRYIHTLLAPITPKLFNKLDSPILSYIEDDGQKVEPEYYIPVLPMLLVNGAIGIGTGFSTCIPAYNPANLAQVIKAKLLGSTSINADFVPWFRGFKGSVKKIDENKYVSVGVWERASPTSIRVTELPVGTWTFDYKTDLEKLLDKVAEFKGYENKSGENINILLNFTSKEATDNLLTKDTTDKNGYTKFENIFELVSTKGLTTTNMYAFNGKGQITKYATPMDILNDFYGIRLDFYKKRKEYILESSQRDMDILDNKIRFIRDVTTEKLKVHKLKKDELIAYLTTQKYKKDNDSYDYLTRIPIYNLTKDKVEELEAEIAALKKVIASVRQKTIQNMWLEDLAAAGF